MFRKLCAMLLAVALENACGMNPRTHSFAERPKYVAPGDAIKLIAEPAIEQAANQQSFSTSWDQLAQLVKPGDAVTVVLTAGGEIEGKLGTFSSSSLTLLVGRGRRELQQREIFLISQSDRDSLQNGALRGLWIGALLNGLLILGFNNDGPRNGEVGAVVAGAALGGGVGGLIGLLADAVTHRDRRVIYAAPAAPVTRVAVSLIPARDRKGVLLPLRFSQ